MTDNPEEVRHLSFGTATRVPPALVCKCGHRVEDHEITGSMQTKCTGLILLAMRFEEDCRFARGECTCTKFK